MDEFIAVSSGWPTAVFSLALVAALTFWLVGLVAGGIEDVELDLDADVSPDTPEGTLGSVVSFLHLDGAPLALSLSFWALFSWFTSYLAATVLGGSDGSLGTLTGVLVGLGAIAVGLLPTMVVVRPVARALARLVAPAMQNAELVGSLARVTTGRVTEVFGQAEVQLPDGTRPRVEVRTSEEGLVADELVLLVEHAGDTYTAVRAPVELGGSVVEARTEEAAPRASEPGAADPPSSGAASS